MILCLLPAYRIDSYTPENSETHGENNMSGFTCRVFFAEEECTRIGEYEMESSFFFDADQYPGINLKTHRKKSGESS